MMFKPSVVMINIQAFDLIRREPSREPSRKHSRATPRARFSHSWFPLGSQSGSRELSSPPTSVFTMKVSHAFTCGCGVLSYSPHTPLDTFGGLRANSSSQILASFRNIAAAEGGSSGVALGGTPDECVSVGPSSPAPQLTSFQLHISELPSSPAPSFPAPSSQLPSPPVSQPHMTFSKLFSIWRFCWCCGIGGEHVFKPTPSKTNATVPKKTPNRA